MKMWTCEDKNTFLNSRQNDKILYNNITCKYWYYFRLSHRISGLNTYELNYYTSKRKPSTFDSYRQNNLLICINPLEMHYALVWINWMQNVAQSCWRLWNGWKIYKHVCLLVFVFLCVIFWTKITIFFMRRKNRKREQTWRKKVHYKCGFYSPWGVWDCEQLTDGAPCSDGVVGLVMSIGICWETLGKSSDFLM